MKTSDLAGAALDYAVALCEGKGDCWGRSAFKPHSMYEGPPYSTSWALAGPIIERELKFIERVEATRWCAGHRRKDQKNGGWNHGYGPTPLIAAMRAFVASKLGDEVDIPKELL